MRRALIALWFCGCHPAPPVAACGTEVAEQHAYAGAEEACAGGKLEACLVQADLLAQGIARPRDWAAAEALRKKACDGGVGPGCARPVAGGPAPSPLAASAAAPEEVPPAPLFTPKHDHPDLTPRLECAANQTRFTAASTAVLDAVAATLAEHPEIGSLVLEGQASEDERDPRALAQARAEAARAELLRRKVAKERLVARAAETATAGKRGVAFRVP